MLDNDVNKTKKLKKKQIFVFSLIQFNMIRDLNDTKVETKEKSKD